MTFLFQFDVPRQQADAAADPAPSDAPGPSAEDLAGLMEFDFELPGAQDPGGEGDAEQEQAPAPVTETPKEEPEPPAEQPSTEPAPPTDPRAAEIAALRETIARLEGKVEAQAPKPADTAPAKDPDDEFVQQAYGSLRVPPELIEALNDDDPSKRGQVLSGLLSGILIRAAKDARTYVRQELSSLRDQVPTLATKTLDERTETERVWTDFSATYPQFSGQRLRPVVGQVAMDTARQWLAEGKQVSWTPEFRDAVAANFSRETGIPLARPDPAAAKPAPKKAPFATGTGTRPAGNPTAEDRFDFLDY